MTFIIESIIPGISLEAPDDSSTPRNPPIIAPKATPQRRDLIDQGEVLDLDKSLDSTAPNLSRRANLSRQNAFEDLDESPLSPNSTASTQDIVDAIGENTMKVSRFIGELADRVKDLETSVNKLT